MTNNKVKRATKAIGELNGYRFIVPSYQRGYRWTKREVKHLLEDLWEFLSKGEYEKGEFYCLQPIVVKKFGENTYLLIDGQQRLTTIFLIIKALKELFGESRFSTSLYSLEYETRRESKEFLEKIENKTEEEAEVTPDFYYMWKAYQVIKNWLEDKKSEVVKKGDMLCEESLTDVMDEDSFIDSFKRIWKYTLKEGRDIENNIRVIWYELDENMNEVKVFTRLNSGKIPLTDAELIRGHLLLKKHFSKNDEEIREERQIEVAKEWDDINSELENDNFWFSLSRENYTTRMDLIFETLLGKKRDDRYSLFFEFKKLYEKKLSKGDAENVWRDIKRVYHMLKYWYEDNDFYHFVGFLVHCGNELWDIYKSLVYKNGQEGIYRNKKEIRVELKKAVAKQSELKKENGKLIVDKKELMSLSYDSDKHTIEKILLFYNVVTTWKSNGKRLDYRFPFDLYKKERWSLEHIDPRSDAEIRETDKAEWLDKNIEILRRILKNTDKLKDIEARRDDFKKKRGEEKRKLFEELKKDILNLFTQSVKDITPLKDEDKDYIWNLCLLTTQQNSLLSNDTFAVKREKIIELDKEGKFIPVATRNVFLKYYSKDINHPYLWTKEDAQSYLEDIKDKLEQFLEGGGQ